MSKLDLIGAQWHNCQRCVLSRTARTQVVVGSGPTPASMMFIGEAPGEQEDSEGMPFIGPAGRELRKHAQAVGIDMDTVFITNLIGCRPPKNRVPMPDEIEECRPRLHALVGIVQPDVIVLLGGVALMAITGKQGITRARGKWVDTEWTWKTVKRTIPTIPALHPSALLRSNDEMDKERFQADLRAAKEKCDG